MSAIDYCLPPLASAQDTPGKSAGRCLQEHLWHRQERHSWLRREDSRRNLWSFQPTKDVRTIAQLFAHVADAQYEFCGVAAEGKSVAKDLEKTLKTKAEIVPALRTRPSRIATAAYANMTDASAAEMVSFFNMKITKLGAMDFNTAHTMEHYGNLVTYMRIKGIVPPSSTPRPPADAKK